MKRLLILLALFAAPALADTVQSLSWNPTTKSFTALTKQNGTKSIQAVGGAAPASIAEVSSNYTVGDLDGISTLHVTTGSATIVITLPLAASNGGREIMIKKRDAGTGKITVQRAGADTIETTTSFDMGIGVSGQFASVTLRSLGTTDWKFSNYQDHGNFTITWTAGPWSTTQTEVVKYARSGRMVALGFSGVAPVTNNTSGATQATTATGALPVSLNPVLNYRNQSVGILNNNVTQQFAGFLQVAPDGSLTLRRDNISTAWTGTTTLVNGWQFFSVSYPIN